MALSRTVVGILVFAACVPGLAAHNSLAQNTGTIEGHVYAADTNGPVRTGNVLLKIAPAEESREEVNVSPPAAIAPVHLNGSFGFSDVKPGHYYLYASVPGYLNPFDSAEASRRGGQNPEGPTAGNPILVELGPNQTVRVNFELQRGGAVEGQILFDDGSPVASIMVRALKKDADGKWREVLIGPGLPYFTDDRGHYRIAGLAAGIYLIEADLSIGPDMVMIKNVMAESQFSVTTRAVYSGSVFDEKDATPFKLTPGEERKGEDLTFRASALHTVSGVVVAQPDGNPVTDAVVEIDEAGGAAVEAVVVDASGTFQFEYVPEGHYTLKVSVARDVNARGRTEREYATAQQPLDVENDTTGLVITVPVAK